ncbi:MAG: hypothetical protein AAF434_17330 [Pseudomonadota bacterium]
MVPNETEIQKTILEVVKAHPDIVWAERMNSGVAKMNGRRVRFGFKGCPDIHGLNKYGKGVYIEVKGEQTEKTAEQLRFINEAREVGALAGFATTPAQAIEIIEGK